MDDISKKQKKELAVAVETFIKNYIELSGLTIDKLELCQNTQNEQDGTITIKTWIQEKTNSNKEPSDEFSRTAKQN